MIEVGHQGGARGLGEYQVQKIAKPREPVEYHDSEGTKFLFHPILAQIRWKNTGDLELWFTYYRQREGEKPRFAGQYGPMLAENTFIELLSAAIEEGFFSQPSLLSLQQVISKRLGRAKEA